VRISFGHLHEGPADPYEYGMEITLKILDTPKPPSPALYFKRHDGRGEYIAKRRLDPKDHAPQGRKFYLHKQSGSREPWRTADPQDRGDRQKSIIRPLKAGLCFYFHIDFDNLSKQELGLLCYAVRPAEAFRHKLGMGKPIGLGQVRIDPLGLFYVDRLARYRETNLSQAKRYHGAAVSGGEDPARWPDMYKDEKETMAQNAGLGGETRSSFSDLRDAFAGSGALQPNIRRALELLGDPEKVTQKVITPQVHGTTGAATEKESYRWFVANDIGSGRGHDRLPPQESFLQPLDASSEGLPTLPEHPFKG